MSCQWYLLQQKILRVRLVYQILGLSFVRGWKACHIRPVGFNTNARIEELAISEIKEHFRKYANPNNLFVLPKKIGYLGEIGEFIAEQKRI